MRILKIIFDKNLNKSIMRKIFLLLIIPVFFCVFYFNSYTINKVNENLKEQLQRVGPNDAALLEIQKISDPNTGEIPIDNLYRAFEKLKSVREKKSFAGNSGIWVERGPNNVGGRTRAIVFDPNDPFRKRVFAGGVNGGLWYNDDITDASSSWHSIDDFLPSLAISSIATNPMNTNEFYCGTGEGWYNSDASRGIGIFKSEDGGKSWNVLSSTYNNTNFQYVQKIIVTTKGTVIAAVRSEDSGGIFRSNDGGLTWEQVIKNSPGADLEISDDYIYASTGIFSTGKLWKSVDDGITWSDVTPTSGGQRIEIAVSESNKLVVYAVASNSANVSWFRKSIDGGNTWTRVSIPFYLNPGSCSTSSIDFTREQAWYDLTLAVSPDNPELLIAGGIDLHRSMDGGNSWQPISYWYYSCEINVHADQHNFIFRPGYSGQAICSNDGGVYYVEDITVDKSAGGPVFEMRNLNYNVTQFYSGAMENIVGSNIFLAGAQDNGSQLFNQRGINSTVEVTGGDGAYCFIDQIDSNIHISSYVYNTYMITRDNWQTDVTVGNSVKGLFINPADYNSRTKTLFAAGRSDTLLRYKNIDKASTIKEESLVHASLKGQISALSISPFSDSILFVGNSIGGLFRISNPEEGSIRSKSIRSSNFPNGYINNVAVGKDENHLIAVFSNYGVKSVWYTNDGGISWMEKEGNLPDVPIRWALFNPNKPNQVMLASEIGIWINDDIEASETYWYTNNDGLGNVRCEMLKYRESDGLVLVATHGRGLFTSDIFSNQSIPDFYINNSVAFQNQKTDFINSSIGSSSFFWDFGDGQFSTENQPTHKFELHGIYDVMLSINDNANLIKKSRVNVLPVLSPDFNLENGGNFDVEQGIFFPVTISGSGFELGKSTTIGKNGTITGEYAWVISPDSKTYEHYSTSYLYTPAFDFSLSGRYELSFFIKFDLESGYDGLILEYSIDNGNNWRKLGDYLEKESWYNMKSTNFSALFPAGKPFFSGTTNNEFVKKTIDLSSLSSNEFVSFRFVFKSDQASEAVGLAIDNFVLKGPENSEPNVGFTLSSENICVGEQVLITNNSVGNIKSYFWSFGEGAIPEYAEGFGPHEVIFNKIGDRLISLEAKVTDEDVVISKSISIGTRPALTNYSLLKSSICFGEVLEIFIQDPENTVNYSVYISKPENEVGSTIVERNDSLIVQVEDLEIGSFMVGINALSSSGCALSLKGTDVVVSDIPLSKITSLGNVLTCSFAGASSYQWFLNSNIIEGATSRKVTAKSEGNYTCLVTKDGCSQMSDSFNYVVLGNTSADNFFYPNPVDTELNIQLSKQGSGEIQVYDLSGKLFMSGSFNNTSELNLDLSKSSSGVKIIEIIQNGEIQRYKILKK